jgi:membrane protein DedA with SNARE-associated domain
MSFLKFSALTVIGSAIWCYVLAVLGVRVGAKALASADGSAERLARAWISASSSPR